MQPRLLQFLRIGVALPLAVVSPKAKAAASATAPEPIDKNFSAGWLAKLPQRGEPRVYTREDSSDLAYIGMPVGGIGAGQLYLGGDGKLWWWDIFNQRIPQGEFPVEQGAAYMKPPREDDMADPRATRLEQGFGVRIEIGDHHWERRLDRSGFKDIEFRGTYPVGMVTWRDPEIPVDVTLEAFSPFVPLSVEASSLPATVLRYRIHNLGSTPAKVALVGWIENGVMLGAPFYAPHRQFLRSDQPGLTFVEGSLRDLPPDQPPIAFESWSSAEFSGWTQSGDAFGRGARNLDTGAGSIARAAASRPGPGKHTSKLTSRPFRIERGRIDFRIAGTAGRARTCFNLVVGGKVVRTATGRDSRVLASQSWDVRDLLGESATLEVVDTGDRPEGYVAVGAIAFVDEPVQTAPAFGTMGLGLVGQPPDAVTIDAHQPAIGSTDKSDACIASLERRTTLAPGADVEADFVLTWYFPNAHLPKIEGERTYGSRFTSARDVGSYIAANANTLVKDTLEWRRTWNDSTLPAWFLTRTFANTSTLATNTTFLVGDSRYYAYEGVYSCPGTCGHVYQYAQAAAHLFPQLERDVRNHVDLGLALNQTNAPGVIDFRGEYGGGFAVDAQAGTLLRVYREHLMSRDDSWLRGLWPRVKAAYAPLFALDPNGDGILEGAQMNTLDQPWFGEIAWLSGLYVAAVRAGEAMANVCGDAAFAERCHAIATRAYTEIPRQLFSGDYFINRVDPAKPDSINSGTGCEIDQMLGQSWAFAVGLPRVLPPVQTRTALESLWTYNLTTDLGLYRKTHRPGRWYGTDNESGLLMCTFPRADWDYARASGEGPEWAAGYFNEVMSGFEHQVAAHCLWEGLVPEGLVIERAIDERYDARKRNPWNEVECGSHYGRAMASYGVFLAACGFTYDGPRGEIGFAPRISATDFRAAFTAAEGWGSFSQKITGASMAAEIEVRWGKLRLTAVQLQAPDAVRTITARLGQRLVPVTFERGNDSTVHLHFKPELTLERGEDLRLTLAP